MRGQSEIEKFMEKNSGEGNVCGLRELETLKNGGTARTRGLRRNRGNGEPERSVVRTDEKVRTLKQVDRVNRDNGSGKSAKKTLSSSRETLATGLHGTPRERGDLYTGLFKSMVR